MVFGSLGTLRQLLKIWIFGEYNLTLLMPAYANIGDLNNLARPRGRECKYSGKGGGVTLSRPAPGAHHFNSGCGDV